MKKSSGRRNAERGDEVENYIAKKYGGSVYREDGFDVELKDHILEIKSCLSYHIGKIKGKSGRHDSRILMGVDDHVDFMKKAKEMGKTPVYVVVKIPRNNDGTEEKDPEKWQEVWISYNNMDTMLQNPEIGRVCSSKWRDRNQERFFYRVNIRHLF